MRGRTTFVIAHRLSTIRRADQILVVEPGASSSGAPTRSFTRMGGRYWDLYTRQHGVERTSSWRRAKATRCLRTGPCRRPHRARFEAKPCLTLSASCEGAGHSQCGARCNS